MSSEEIKLMRLRKLQSFKKMFAKMDVAFCSSSLHIEADLTLTRSLLHSSVKGFAVAETRHDIIVKSLNSGIAPAFLTEDNLMMLSAEVMKDEKRWLMWFR